MRVLRQLFIIITICVVTGLPALLGAQEEVKTGPWREVNKKDGFTAYLRTTSRSKMDQTKSEGIIRAQVQTLQNILREPANWQKIIFMAKEVKKIETPANMPADGTYLYANAAMPWPVANRTFVGKLIETRDNQTGEVNLTLNNVPAQYKYPDGVVVPLIVEIIWNLKPLPDGTTYVTVVGLGDLGGQLPAPAINFLLKYIALKSVINLRDLAVK